MKRLAILCAATLVLTGCANSGSDDIIDDVSDVVSDMMQEGEEEYTLYMGLYENNDASESKTSFASTYVSVICDRDGRIVDCEFDATEHSVAIDEGIAKRKESYPSKREQGNDYGMKPASGIEKEWYQQADWFAEHIKGYTLKEAYEVESGDSELKAGCTIDISGFKAALEASEGQAVKEFRSKDTPEASLAVVSRDDGTKDAVEDSEGAVALTSTYCAVALDGNKIAAAIIEETESKTFFSNKGTVTESQSGHGKRSQGDSYGMKAASEIGLEWKEQIENFEGYIVGMNSEQVASIGMTGDYAADEKLSSGCTVKINYYVAAASQASER